MTRRIAWVTGPPTVPQCAARARGVTRAADAAGITNVTITVPLMASASGERAGAEFLTMRNRPTALFCANDLLALGVLRALLADAVAVPEQVSLIGYDDIEFCTSAAVPLSSVAQPAYQLGATAPGLLLDECESSARHAHQQVLFRPRLVARASTGPAPGAGALRTGRASAKGREEAGCVSRWGRAETANANSVKGSR